MKNHVVEKVGSPQDERRSKRIYEKTPHREVQMPNPDRKQAQPGVHATLLNPADLTRTQLLPIHTQLVGQTPRRNGEIRTRIEEKIVAAVTLEKPDINRYLGVADEAEWRALLAQRERNRHGSLQPAPRIR